MNAVSGGILALGDSLSEGYGVAEEESYPALLEKKLQAAGFGCTVHNAGISGEYSRGAASRLPGLLERVKPVMVILETGANDGLQGLDPTETEANIDGMLALLAEKNIPVLLAGMKMAWNFGPQYVRRFNELYPRLARKYDVVFMPFFLEDVALHPELNLGDGLHPNADGYHIITDNIFPYVKKTLERYQQR